MTGYADAQPLLDDSRVGKIADRLRLEFPDIPYETQFVTAVIEPPYNAHNGTEQYREERWPAFQFMVLSPHPRPLQRKRGMLHAKVATGFKAAWDEQEAERKHYVTADEDPAYKIFRALAWSFIQERRSLLQITN